MTALGPMARARCCSWQRPLGRIVSLAALAAGGGALLACGANPADTRLDIVDEGAAAASWKNEGPRGVQLDAPADGAPVTPAEGARATCSGEVDHCPARNGVAAQCKTRFLYGVNYAWSGSAFGLEFGGAAAWNVGGVARERGRHERDLADMRAHGVRVVRWWVYPELRGEGVRLQGDGAPAGLGGTAVEDFEAALQVAEAADVHVMLCLFSFDGFRPERVEGGMRIPSLRPMVEDAGKRRALLENVVRAIARTVARSPHAHRLVAWDVINEPEWALRGRDRFGDPDFDPDPHLQPVTHEQMETFLAETIRVLREESSAAVTVGGAALKWARAWKGLSLDFYQFHTYDWVEAHYPFTRPLQEYGLGDKPVVMGEFPMRGVAGYDWRGLVEALEAHGYAGALGWAFNDPQYPWEPAKSAVREAPFASQCSSQL